MIGTAFGTALAMVALDRWTKRRVRARPPGRWSVALAPGVTVRHVRVPVNPGTALRWAVALVLPVTILAAAAMTGGVFDTAVSQAGVGAAVAGAASNVFDRMRYRCMTDFVCVGWWPPFNVADVAIVAGVATALFSLARTGLT